MEISKGSWHYRLGKEFRNTFPPENLCPYVRWVLGAIFLVSVLASFAVGISVAAGWTLWGMLSLAIGVSLHGSTFLAVASIGDPGPFVAFGLFGWAISALAFLAFASKLRIRGGKRLAHRAMGTSAVASRREPNIFLEWLKAKHQKVCPSIEFVQKERRYG